MPNCKEWDLAGPKDGTSSNLFLSVVGTGAGAPLYIHENDEIIVALKGTTGFQIGDDVQLVNSHHTVIIPSKAPHSPQ